jgi:magnesium-transporting ATPase (P-type)
LKILRRNPAADVIKRSLDVITIAVPPALPGALTAGLIYGQNRLRKQKVYCISPRTINICGTLNTIVFDKTGTLTEDGLDLKCVLPAGRLSNGSFEFVNDNLPTSESLPPTPSQEQPPQSQPPKYPSIDSDIIFGKPITEVTEFPKHNRLLEAMASCHSITRIHGELAGDPLDCKMFEFTHWELFEPTSEETVNYDMLVPTIVHPKTHKNRKSMELTDLYEVGIIRQFPFSSSLQRMSVVVKVLHRDYFELYCKGSPEKIAEMCKPETLPKDFQVILTSYTREGYRVIAVATKRLSKINSIVKVQRIERC